MSFKSLFLCAAVLAMLTAGVLAETVSIDFVTVGNPGNAADAETGYGAVNHSFMMGKYEVTAKQYCTFLNAVAATDPNGLYLEKMITDNNTSKGDGCKIRRFGEDGGYSYVVDADGDGIEDADLINRPVNYVSWWDAVRFVNWLENGQPTGAQDATTTEDGTYDLSLGAATVRKAGCTYFLPSEDEWYKAAYYDPDKGDGAGGYWDYATGTNDLPSNQLVDPDPGNNSTHKYSEDGSYTLGIPYWRTEVGAHENSASPYGTFDQNGNVGEHNETVYEGDVTHVRGGAWLDNEVALPRTFYFTRNPTKEPRAYGFRVAAVPEPGTTVLVVFGALCGMLCSRVRRR
jgi:formylglycine-generating enzyme required for sulfatase activity